MKKYDYVTHKDSPEMPVARKQMRSRCGTCHRSPLRMRCVPLGLRVAEIIRLSVFVLSLVHERI